LRPSLTVIVCAGEQADELGPMLAGLAQQTLTRDAFEVVLVAEGQDGRAPETALAVEAELPVRVVREPGAGRAAARNRGVMAARGEIVAFFGGGAVPSPRFLEAHLEAHRRWPDPATAVRGDLRLAPALAAEPLGRVLARIDGSAFRARVRPQRGRLEFEDFRAECSSCKRSFLLEHGLFNPEFRSGYDDVELAWRLSAHGFAIRHEPGAVATIARMPAFDDLCRKFREDGAARFLLSRLYPHEPVLRFTQVKEASRLWSTVGLAHEALVRSARELDRLVRLRRELGLEVTSREVTLLERGYWTAFRTSRLAGIIQQADKMGCDLADAPEPPLPPARPDEAQSARRA
jgi:glycosyltransferase involved in cell wall biosynthesis